VGDDRGAAGGKAQKALAPYRGSYEHLRHLWERKLRHMCGDLHGLEWAGFRPLRLSREEDWSDWLAWLLQTSITGVLAEAMLGQHMGCGSASLGTPKIRREVPTETGERRADLVVEWRSGRRTHIEVKVGDENFEKTFETCRGLHRKVSGRVWCHAILIPDASRTAWDEVAEAHEADCAVEVILWSDVVRGLRRSLWDIREPIAWQAWAWAFCGAVESHLLGLQKPNFLRSRIADLDMVSRWVEVLKEGAGCSL